MNYAALYTKLMIRAEYYRDKSDFFAACLQRAKRHASDASRWGLETADEWDSHARECAVSYGRYDGMAGRLEALAARCLDHAAVLRARRLEASGWYCADY